MGEGAREDDRGGDRRVRPAPGRQLCARKAGRASRLPGPPEPRPARDGAARSLDRRDAQGGGAAHRRGAPPPPPPPPPPAQQPPPQQPPPHHPPPPADRGPPPPQH